MNDAKRNTQFVWTREATKTLIEMYERYPCLYVSTLPEYRNKNVRTAAFETIAIELNKTLSSNVSLHDIKRKMHIIRTQFTNEIQKIKKSQALGDNIYTPKLWCFNLLAFLKGGTARVTQDELNFSLTVDDTEQPKFEHVIYDDGDDDDDTNLTQFDLLSPASSRTPSRSDAESQGEFTQRPKKIKSENMAKVNDLIETAVHTLRNINKTEEERILANSANKLFAQTIEAELNKINDEEILDEVKQKVLHVIVEGKRLLRQKYTSN